MQFNARIALFSLLVAFCTNGNQSLASSDDTDSNQDAPPREGALTVATAANWAQDAWREYTRYRSAYENALRGNLPEPHDPVVLMRQWNETSQISESNGGVKWITAQTYAMASLDESPYMDFVFVSYKYRRGGIFDLRIGRGIRGLYPEIEFVILQDNDADGIFDQIIVGETLDENTVVERERVSRNGDNENTFSDLESLLENIKTNSGFEQRRIRWENLWSD